MSTTPVSRPTGAGSIISATIGQRPALAGRAAGRTPEQVTDFTTDVGGYLLAPTGDRIAIWADRDMRLRRLQLRERARPRRPGRAAAGPMTRPSSATGTPGRRRACARASSSCRWPTAGRRARGRRCRPSLAGDSPSKPFGGAEELAWSPDGRTLYFTLREGGRTEPNSTNLDIYAAPEGGQVDEPDRRQTGRPTPRRSFRPTASGSPTRRWRGRPMRRIGWSSSCATCAPARPAR